MINKIAKTYFQLIKYLPIKVTPDLKNTPIRAAKALLELIDGYYVDIDKIIGKAIYENEKNEIVILKNIEFFSMCEHHILPIIGTCHVAYIPDKKIIGLSKIPRIVECFAKRLQLQERLTSDIAYKIDSVLKPKGVAVYINAFHLCISARGIKKNTSKAITSCYLGNFKKQSIRKNFLNLIKQ